MIVSTGKYTTASGSVYNYPALPDLAKEYKYLAIIEWWHAGEMAYMRRLLAFNNFSIVKSENATYGVWHDTKVSGIRWKSKNGQWVREGSMSFNIVNQDPYSRTYSTLWTNADIPCKNDDETEYIAIKAGTYSGLSLRYGWRNNDGTEDANTSKMSWVYGDTHTEGTWFCQAESSNEDETLTFDWYKNNVKDSGHAGTTESTVINLEEEIGTYKYKCTVTTSSGLSVTTGEMTIEITEYPVITSASVSPLSMTLKPGENCKAVVKVQTNGECIKKIQWCNTAVGTLLTGTNISINEDETVATLHIGDREYQSGFDIKADVSIYANNKDTGESMLVDERHLTIPVTVTNPVTVSSGSTSGSTTPSYPLEPDNGGSGNGSGGEGSTITGITISPSSANIRASESVPFSIAVSGTGDYDSNYGWFLIGGYSENTRFDGTTLYTGEDETIENITIQVYSEQNPNYLAVATVAITPNRVTGISVTPDYIELEPGCSQQFEIEVNGTGVYDSTFNYELINIDGSTSFDVDTCTLVVGEDESEHEFTLRIVSVEDENFSVDVSVLVSKFYEKHYNGKLPIIWDCRNDVTGLPAATVYNTDSESALILTWDGNVDGKCYITVNGENNGFYKVSDRIFDAIELSGISYVNSDGNVGLLSDAMELMPGLICSSNANVISGLAGVYDGVTVPEDGTYFIYNDEYYLTEVSFPHAKVPVGYKISDFCQPIESLVGEPYTLILNGTPENGTLDSDSLSTINSYLYVTMNALLIVCHADEYDYGGFMLFPESGLYLSSELVGMDAQFVIGEYDESDDPIINQELDMNSFMLGYKAGKKLRRIRIIGF